MAEQRGNMTGQQTALRVLVVDDDPLLCEMLRAALGIEGIEVLEAHHVIESEAVLAEAAPDAIVLDVGLPGIDGFEVCRRVRAQSNVPIVMLTARDDEPDRVVGFELGADDYVPKPFSPRELEARIRAILRRAEPRSSEDAVLSAGEIVLRRDSHDVTVDGEAVQLTAKEFDLLTCFLEHQGIVLSRERLLDIVWGMSYPGGTRTVDMHVAQLRRKLGDAEAIHTVRGAGYKLVHG